MIYWTVTAPHYHNMHKWPKEALKTIYIYFFNSPVTLLFLLFDLNIYMFKRPWKVIPWFWHFQKSPIIPEIRLVVVAISTCRIWSYPLFPIFFSLCLEKNMNNVCVYYQILQAKRINERSVPDDTKNVNIPVGFHRVRVQTSCKNPGRWQKPVWSLRAPRSQRPGAVCLHGWTRARKVYEWIHRDRLLHHDWEWNEDGPSGITRLFGGSHGKLGTFDLQVGSFYSFLIYGFRW